MSKTHEYAFCCVGCRDVRELDRMIAGARDVTYETVRKYAAGLAEWATEQGYDRYLKLKDDWAVSFHKSKWKGKVCYYVRWSSIEFVWLLKESGCERTVLRRGGLRAPQVDISGQGGELD